MWLGLSDVDSPGKLRWVNGSEAREREEGPPPRSPISRGNVCVSLDQRGQASSHPCNAKRAYVCQYSPQGRLHSFTHTHTLNDTCSHKRRSSKATVKRTRVKTQAQIQCKCNFPKSLCALVVWAKGREFQPSSLSILCKSRRGTNKRRKEKQTASFRTNHKHKTSSLKHYL